MSNISLVLTTGCQSAFISCQGLTIFLTIYPAFATLTSRKRRQHHLRNCYPLLRGMANRCKQSRIRWRHRYDCRPDVHAIPQCAKRHRTDAPAPPLNRYILTPTLLAAMAPSKRYTVDPRFRARYHLSKPNFEGHFRFSSQKGNRRHRLLVRDLRIPASVLATVSWKFREACSDSSSIQNVARAPCWHVRRCVLYPCSYGRTCCYHVFTPSTFRQRSLRCYHYCYLLPTQPP